MDEKKIIHVLDKKREINLEHKIDPWKKVEYVGNEILLFENRVEREWLATKEAAHFLGISENALRILVHRGQVQAFKFGRRLRFRLKDLQALFQKKGA